MRSVRFVAATAPVVVLLSGCVPTQRIAARARLMDARVLASQSPTVVMRANPRVSVGPVTVIHGRSGSAMVVSLVNHSARALTDLPVSVGVRPGSRRNEYLNRATNLDYFETHVPAIAPHAGTTWVFTTRRRITGGRPFATVGISKLHSQTGARLPRIAVALRAQSSGHASAGVDLLVSNQSAIPQYDLQVYAVAVRAGREVAAGRATVGHLGTHGRTTVSMTLLGSTRGAVLRLIAVPTIFS